jgi:GNAT superfamily N-acetyltransferase
LIGGDLGARANHDKGFTVATVVHEANRVVGYDGVAPTAVTPRSMPRRLRTGQSPDPVPCLLVVQLATDVAFAGRGVGIGLLEHALVRCVDAARLIGGGAIVVRAVDDDARELWLRRGFLPSKDDPFVLFRSIRDVAASLVAASGTGHR